MKRLIGLFRVALIDLRGSARRFAIIVACIALGTTAIGLVSSVGATLSDAVRLDARQILGGDLEVRLQQFDATPAQRRAFDGLGRVSREVELNSRAVKGDGNAFLSLRAVGRNYPLASAVTFHDATKSSVWDRIRLIDGVPGVVLAPEAVLRLDATVGDMIRIGSLDFQLRGIIDALPDQAALGLQLGASAIIADSALDASGLDQNGVLSRYRYKIELGGDTFAAAKLSLDQQFPDSDWQIRSPSDATLGIERSFRVFGNFLFLVGLSSLFVGGLGIQNAVAAYLTDRQGSIAIMRSLGARSSRLITHFLLQILAFSLVGVAIASAIVIAVTTLGLPLIESTLGLPLEMAPRTSIMLASAALGLVASLLFAWIPLQAVRNVRPAVLFRAAGTLSIRAPDWPEVRRAALWGPVLAGAIVLFVLAASITGEPLLVAPFIVAMLAASAVLRAAGMVFVALVRRTRRSGSQVVRLAMSSVSRPGAPTVPAITSLGMGLSLLLIIVLTQSSIGRQIDSVLLKQAPSFIVLDLDPDTKRQLEDFAARETAVAQFDPTPMLRATIVTIDGVPAPNADAVPANVADMFRGDTPITWQGEEPADAEIASGHWWPAKYDGPPLLSLSTELRDALHLKLGESVGLTVLGRSLTATIASFRNIDWRSPRFNFRMILSPGLIEGAPQSYMAGLRVEPGTDDAVEAKLVKQFPTLNFVSVGRTVQRAQVVIASLGQAISLVGAIAVLAGVLVLAGALSAGRRQRESDAVIMKVLGATRGMIIGAFVLEYMFIGTISAIVALCLGGLASWGLSKFFLDLDFSLDVGLVVATVMGVSLLTIATGAMSTWSALSVRPADQLRSGQ